MEVGAPLHRRPVSGRSCEIRLVETGEDPRPAGRAWCGVPALSAGVVLGAAPE